MKRRYCINIDKCIALPMVLPIGWFIFLLGLFLTTFFISFAKRESSLFLESIVSSGAVWLYLSSPISFAFSALVGLCFVCFPVSYVEVGDKSVRVHRAFKKDRVIPYEDLNFVRLSERRRREWIGVLFVVFAGGDLNTIEIRKEYPLPSLWLSASRRAYDAIAEKLKSACIGKKDLVISDSYVAESRWVSEHGNPQNLEWSGHYGRF